MNLKNEGATSPISTYETTQPRNLLFEVFVDHSINDEIEMRLK